MNWKQDRDKEYDKQEKTDREQDKEYDSKRKRTQKTDWEYNRNMTARENGLETGQRHTVR